MSTGPSDVVSGMVGALIVAFWFGLIVGPPIAIVWIAFHFIAKFW